MKLTSVGTDSVVIHRLHRECLFCGALTKQAGSQGNYEYGTIALIRIIKKNETYTFPITLKDLGSMCLGTTYLPNCQWL